VDQSLDLITGPLDRSLSVPIGTQLRGIIQYRISSGVLAKGTRLPSIKDLAEASGLAPMTVATAYRALQAIGLIASRPGAGTFVAETDVEWGHQTDTVRRIEEQVDKLLAQARAVGMSTAEVAGILHARASSAPQTKVGQGLHIVMVGLFEEATQAYADDLALYCQKDDRVEAITIEQLRSAEAGHETPDLYVSLVSRRREVATLVKRRAPVASIRLIPSERTRASLAAIDPTARLCIVSMLPEFLALMKPSVMQFVPHLRDVDVALVDGADLKGKLSRCDAVIYATGADSILEQIQPGTNAIEYRHVPDPHSVKRVLMPLIDELRSARERETSERS
jgi:DNA-binding transcriptional regulator YhcF (GntR family)